MALSSLLPIGGAALGALAARTLGGLGESLSFQDHLRREAERAEPAAAGPATEPQATLDLATALPDFIAQLQERLEAAGVDLTQPLTLKPDGNGGIMVDGEHPDRALVESLLQDSELAGTFEEIAAAATERRRAQPGVDNVFGEFRLRMDGKSAAIGFE
jgi:hypothetical protein